MLKGIRILNVIRRKTNASYAFPLKHWNQMQSFHRTR